MTDNSIKKFFIVFVLYHSKQKKASKERERTRKIFPTLPFLRKFLLFERDFCQSFPYFPVLPQKRKILTPLKACISAFSSFIILS